MTALFTVAANFILLVSALGFGSLLLGRISSCFSPLDRTAVALLGGLGIQGTVLFLVGQVWFTPLTVRIVLAVGVISAIRFLVSRRRSLRAVFSVPSISFLPAVIISVVLVITAIGGLAEPTGDIKMDEIAYHLLGPKVWLRDALIQPVPDEAYTAFPAIVEVQYAALMSLAGPLAPGFTAVTSLLCILLIAASLAVRFGLNTSSAWWVAALLITMPVLYRGAYDGFVDVLYSSFVLAALRVGLDARSPASWAVVGLFCGSAIATKYTGLIAVLLLFVCFFFLSGFEGSGPPRPSAKELAIACIGVIIVGGPWYLRNWRLLGCPIYPPPPILWRLFRTRYLSAEAITHFHAAILRAGAGMGRGPLSLVLLPFHLTFHPANFLNGAGGIGLTPLALAPFGLLIRRRDRLPMASALFGFLQTIVWFYTEQEARFLIHVYVIAAIFAVFGWSYVAQVAGKLGALLASLAVAFSALYGFVVIGSARSDDLHAALSPRFENQRLQEEIPFRASFQFLNSQPSLGRVLVLDPQVPTYYLDKDYLKPLGRWGEQSLPSPDDVDALLAKLSPLDIAYVLDVREATHPFRLPPHPSGLTLVFELEDQRVYKVE